MKNDKHGYALITVMLIITALGFTVGMLTQIGRQRMFDAQYRVNKVKALAYAEAGVDHAYAILSTDFSQRNNPDAFSFNSDGSETGTETGTTWGGSDGSSTFQSADGSTSVVKNDYSEGAFELNLTPISNRYVVVTSHGECNGIVQTVEVLIEDIYAGSGKNEAPDYEDMEAFNYAIVTGGDFVFRGCGSIVGSPTARMHSNSDIDINGDADTQVNVTSTTGVQVGNNTVNGSITAPEVDLHKKASITEGSAEAEVPPIEIPDVDLTPYFNHAKKYGEVHNGFVTKSSYTPNGGILYVIGDVEISGHAVIDGSIIATGNVKISGQVQIKPAAGRAFAIATESGDIDNTTSGRIEGLIYTKSGNYKQTANGVLYGQLIIGGEVQKGGNSDIIVYQQYIPNPPGVGTAVPSKSLPLISAWQK
jgi:hypothetical protein